MLIIFTVVELSLNTYNSLKNNYRMKSYDSYQYVKDEVPRILNQLKQEDDEFYRFELVDDYTSDDGLYFGYHGINYFNSVRNINVNNLFERLGVTVYDKCHIELLELDPVTLSLLNIKYLYGENVPHLKKKDASLFENPHSLSLGFMAKHEIADITLSDDLPYENKTKILNALSGVNEEIYDIVPIDKFEMKKEDYVTKYTYSFTAEDEYLLMPEFEGIITIDGAEYHMNDRYFTIGKGQKVTVLYEIYEEYEDEDVFLALLDLSAYENQVSLLEHNMLTNIKTNTSGTTILEADIESDGTYDYLFTSIEYEQGMKVYLDGKEVEPDIVLDALIGLPVEKGAHTIKISYIPKGLLAGTGLSLVALGACVFYLQRRKKVI